MSLFIEKEITEHIKSLISLCNKIELSSCGEWQERQNYHINLYFMARFHLNFVFLSLNSGYTRELMKLQARIDTVL